MRKLKPPLTAAEIRALDRPGLYPDRGAPCLYVQVARGGSRSWVLRYGIGGRRKDMGLGGTTLFTPAEARKAAKQALKLARAGIDPIAERRARSGKAEIGSAITFKKCAEDYIRAHSAGWSAKYKIGLIALLERFVFPTIGSRPVRAVEVTAVMEILEPLWLKKYVTMARLRGQLERILDFAKAKGDRQGENPARWRGHLSNLLPKRQSRVEHRPAMPYLDLPMFMVKLRAEEGIAARGLELLVLTAVRSGEVRGMLWDDLDLSARVWTIPAERTKAGREHRVPLSAPAVAVIEAMVPVRFSPFVFPGQSGAINRMAMLNVLKRLGYGGDSAVVHGFRSAFRDWVAERTNYPREVAELALAHVVGGATERAYARSDLFARRAEMMDDWARFCGEAPAQVVVPLRA